MLSHHDRYPHHHLYHHDRHPPKNKECSLILTPSSALALFHQVNAVRHHRNTNVIVFKIENNNLKINSDQKKCSGIFLIFGFTFTDQFPERFYWVAFLLTVPSDFQYLMSQSQNYFCKKFCLSISDLRQQSLEQDREDKPYPLASLKASSK